MQILNNPRLDERDFDKTGAQQSPGPGDEDLLILNERKEVPVNENLAEFSQEESDNEIEAIDTEGENVVEAGEESRAESAAKNKEASRSSFQSSSKLAGDFDMVESKQIFDTTMYEDKNGVIDEPTNNEESYMNYMHDTSQNEEYGNVKRDDAEIQMIETIYDTTRNKYADHVLEHEIDEINQMSEEEKNQRYLPSVSVKPLLPEHQRSHENFTSHLTESAKNFKEQVF